MSKKYEASNVRREMSRKVKVTTLAVGELRRGDWLHQSNKRLERYIKKGATLLQIRFKLLIPFCESKSLEENVGRWPFRVTELKV